MSWWGWECTPPLPPNHAPPAPSPYSPAPRRAPSPAHARDCSQLPRAAIAPALRPPSPTPAKKKKKNSSSSVRPAPGRPQAGGRGRRKGG